MPWWMMFFASGSLLYVGMVLACVGMAMGLCIQRGFAKGIGWCLALLGAVGVILSAAPLPFWLYALWFLMWLGAMIVTNWPELDLSWRGVAFAVYTVACVFICWGEISRSSLPKLSIPENATALCVIGDSLSIGAQDEASNWPELLGGRLELPLMKHAFAGAKAGSSLNNAKRIGADPVLILLEIGGNDLLDGTPPGQFESDLRSLLDIVRGPERTVLMLELPLPPSYNRYGMVQRSLAKEFGVTLVPKSVLCNVLSTPDATVDGLHLSLIGHAALADRIAQLFGK